ncbi:gluconokinase [Nocardia sp. NPDC058176]|uniref:gluconokinase n=1 Tax=Nocardia sp. NPDC058176 TaxID=3346368 RepID=UPI0036DB568E
MGVSGSGKSTVGALLAGRLELPYAEGDGFHPQANIEKMAAGIPLDDADRAPWLDIVADWLGAHSDHGGVAACSALKRAYRDRLRAGAPQTYFVFLDAPRVELERRMAARLGHFMPTSLLDSQLATLEPLEPDEAGITLDATDEQQRLVTEAMVAWAADHR